MDKQIKIELKEDKIMDILMHAATREDIAAVRNELKADIAGVRNELKADIAGVRNELKGDIAGVRNELTGFRNELKGDIDKLDNKMDKAIWFILASILVPILLQVVPHLLK